VVIIIGYLSDSIILSKRTAKYVCCCTDCPAWYNDCRACSFPCWCGDRVHYTPFQSACCGLCPTTATPAHNCFGLCGPKNGEPLRSFPLIGGLLPASGEKLATALENARASWLSRTKPFAPQGRAHIGSVYPGLPQGQGQAEDLEYVDTIAHAVDVQYVDNPVPVAGAYYADDASPYAKMA
jgi:hypothetical protein